jgi:hypothetical protein
LNSFKNCGRQLANDDIFQAKIKRNVILLAMDESRKKLIYLVAGMFLVRRLAGLDRRPSPARENAFRDANDNAVELMRRLNARFPSPAKPR